MISSQEKPVQNILCLNTYEQQLEIENRLNKLMKTLIKTDDLRNLTETAKNNLKEEVKTTFNTLRIKLIDMENKLNCQIESDLTQTNMESQMRSIESQVNQLIGGLKNMSMLTDSQKLLILRNVDGSINNLETNIKSLEATRFREIEKLTLETTKALNDLNNIGEVSRMKKIFEDQNANIQSLSVRMSSILQMNQETKKILNSNDEYNYSDWLLRSNKLNTDSVILKKVESFEDLSFNQDFDIISDSENDESSNQINSHSMSSNEIPNFFQLTESQKSSPFFSDIYSKPMEFWLLKRK